MSDVPETSGVKTSSSLSLITAETVVGLLFDLIDFTTDTAKLSASETIAFRSIVVVFPAVTCEGKTLLTTGTELLVKYRQ